MKPSVLKKTTVAPVRLLRALVYARFSSDNQQEESIEAQLAAIEKYCRDHNIMVVGTYVDRAKSATTDKRPEFQKLINEATSGICDIVIVHKVNRFARNRYDSAFYKRQLKMAGVELRYVELPFEDSHLMILLEGMLEAYAEFYSKELSVEVMKVMLPNAEKGLHLGGVPPYGYQVNRETKRYEIHDREARAVRIYWEGVLSGRSLDSIADELNSMGYRTRSGKPFVRNSFSSWARNRKYKGDYVWNVREAKREDGTRNNHAQKPIEEQIIIPDIVPKIVSNEEWDAMQEILAHRKHKPGAQKAKHSWLLSGKIICAKCGSNFQGDSYRNKKSKKHTLLLYYRCSNRACDASKIRKDDIEGAVIDNLIQTCFTASALETVSHQVMDLYRKDVEAGKQAVAPLLREIETLDRRISNWLDLAGEGIGGVVDKIKQAELQKEEIKVELKRIELMHSSSSFVDEKFVKNILETKKHSLFSRNGEEKKQVLQEFVNSVVVETRAIHEFDANLSYRVFNGGGEGNRTPVRRPRCMSFYECSRLICSSPSGRGATRCQQASSLSFRRRTTSKSFDYPAKVTF